MKTRYKILIVIIILAFVIWSSVDTVCRSSVSGNIMSVGELSFLMCNYEPRWYHWFR